MQTISQRLKQKRAELKMTQTELALKAGVKQQSIQQIEAGITKRPRKIFEIAVALQCDPVWLQYGNGVNICKTCNGKGVVSSSCRDCSGRGRAVDRKLTEQQGVPVMGDCKRCCGRGYERIPSTDVHRTVEGLTDAISLDTWKKSVKPFYDGLIGKIEIEESWANASLNKLTG